MRTLTAIEKYVNGELTLAQARKIVRENAGKGSNWSNAAFDRTVAAMKAEQRKLASLSRNRTRGRKAR